MSTATDSNLELLAVDPDAVVERMAQRLHRLDRDATSSELVYTPQGPHGFYRDLLAAGGLIQNVPGADQRLARHGEQMDRAYKLREERARRSLAAFEYRVTPDTIPGAGGYLAPPLWLNALFATANRPGRVLADLISARFPLPRGVSSVNLPIIATGSVAGSQVDDASVPSADITDLAGVSPVATLDGFVDVSVQLFDQSPVTAAVDWAVFLDLSEATDAQLELELIVGNGTGITSSQLIGLAGGVLTGTNAITFPATTITGSALYPYLGQAVAQIGDNRLRPPEAWLMRTARWAWIKTSEDTATMPLDLSVPFFLGSTDDTPDPIGAIAGFPVFLDDAIPNTLGAGSNQDLIICLRPSDLILLESEPQTLVAREPVTMGVRLRMHRYAAAITGRRPAGISVISGSGLARVAGF